jgi:formylglycine-generating enzyme required for sulfatase activity
MRTLLFAILLFGIYSFVGLANKKSPKLKIKSYTNLPKEIISITGDLMYVPSGTFVSDFKLNDSTFHPERQVSVQAFYMSRTEVTNLQYRTFYNEMVKLVGLDSASYFLPDTSSFVKDLPYAFSEPMEKNYYSHPAYDNYPVIGVSWFQASGYVKWLNYEVDKLIKSNPEWREKYGLNFFRIPTEMEWEYAAKGDSKRNQYSWGSEFMTAKKDKVIWKGNFGNIKDENGVLIKSHMDDNAFFMAKADSYSPNGFGLYNMSGNVNEWLDDTYSDNSTAEYQSNFYKYAYDTTVKNGREKFLQYRDSHFIPGVSEKVIKGGSYLDSPAWCIIGNRRSMAPDSARCDVGFRVVNTYFYNKEHFESK